MGEEGVLRRARRSGSEPVRFAWPPASAVSDAGSGANGPRRSFGASPASVGAARHFARDQLDGLEPPAIDAVVLMVSELTTNALCHGGGAFELRLERSGSGVTVEVDDPGPGRPCRREPAPFEGDGRGLRIVEELATRWGVREHDQGKVVWFHLEW